MAANMAWALVIHENPDMCEALVGFVKDALPDATCLGALNIADGEHQLRSKGIQSCALIVAGASVPLNADQPPALERVELTGLGFATRLREEGFSKPPVVLLGAFQDTQRLKEIKQVENIEFVGFSSASDAIRRARDRQTISPAGHIDLTIDLRGNSNWSWRLSGRGPTSVLEDSGAINIKDEERRDLRDWSEQLETMRTCRILNRVGTRTYKYLMADSLKSEWLEIKLERTVKALGGGLEFARIGFNVNADTHDILFESLATPHVYQGDEESEPDFWAFKTPIFRKYDNRGERYPLFKDQQSRDGPVNCLIIQGNVEPFAIANPIRRQFFPIPEAAGEVAELTRYLGENREKFHLGEIRSLIYGSQPGSFAAQIEDALMEKKWGLVHYAGHSVIDGSTSAEATNGYLVLGGGHEEMLDAKRFAQWARQAQFIFLSSCQSAGAKFIMRLVHEKIPAVAGYAWQIDDAAACLFSRKFYRNLFEEGPRTRFIEYAFMRAKQQVHDEEPEQTHWAAPLLIMQVSGAARDI